MEQERQFNKTMRLLNETSRNVTELKKLLKSPPDEDLTLDEQKYLQIALLELVVAVREFGKK